MNNTHFTWRTWWQRIWRKGLWALVASKRWNMNGEMHSRHPHYVNISSTYLFVWKKQIFRRARLQNHIELFKTILAYLQRGEWFSATFIGSRLVQEICSMCCYSFARNSSTIWDIIAKWVSKLKKKKSVRSVKHKL